VQHRKLGRTDLAVSAIGLGTEYLIDVPRDTVLAVVGEAIARGVNYFDLFWAQPEFRDNMGAAFKGHRGRVMLAAHLGATHQEGQYQKSRDPGASERFFVDFLRRYDTDYADVLFLHNSDGQEDYDELLKPGGLLDLAQRLQREGRARFVGFSGHTPETARQAVESGRIDVLMFPVNLTNHAAQGRAELLAACLAHDVGLVAMKPFAGGKLLQEGAFPEAGSPAPGSEKPPPVTPAQCLSYALGQLGVSTVVPGCKNPEELAGALAYWRAAEEEKDFSAVVARFQQCVAGECVYCNHCLPCPAEIDIGGLLRLLDRAALRLTDELRSEYDGLRAKAPDCVECGSCAERCPFGVDVISKMKQAQERFS